MIIDDSWYQRPKNIPTRMVAGGVVAKVEHDVVLIALVSENREDMYYLLPKGGVEEGESIEQAARREIEEEAGLTELQLLAELGVTERLEFNKKTWCVAHYFLFTTDSEAGLPTDKSKHYTLEWFPLHNLPNFFWPDQKQLVADNREKITTLLRNGKKT